MPQNAVKGKCRDTRVGGGKELFHTPIKQLNNQHISRCFKKKNHFKYLKHKNSEDSTR